MMLAYTQLIFCILSILICYLSLEPKIANGEDDFIHDAEAVEGSDELEILKKDLASNDIDTIEEPLTHINSNAVRSKGRI